MSGKDQSSHPKLVTNRTNAPQLSFRSRPKLREPVFLSLMEAEFAQLKAYQKFHLRLQAEYLARLSEINQSSKKKCGFARSAGKRYTCPPARHSVRVCPQTWAKGGAHLSRQAGISCPSSSLMLRLKINRWGEILGNKEDETESSFEFICITIHNQSQSHSGSRHRSRGSNGSVRFIIMVAPIGPKTAASDHPPT